MSDREHAPTSDGPAAPPAEPSPSAPSAPDGATSSADAEADAGAATADADADPQGHGVAAAPVEDPRSPQELRAELAEAESRRDEYLDDLRRARAEFENYRKRTTREAGGARELGRADVVGALLDVLDDVDRTREAADSSSDESLAKAVELVADKLARTLAGQGLERIDETGVAFDPDVHEAVQQVEADEEVDQPQVHQVLRAGYRLGPRTLRAAMVVVEG